MIDALVFSRDRAAQLDLLLRSVERFAPKVYRTMTVLYTHGPEHALAYQYCRQDHPRVLFEPERDFEQQVRGWLRDWPIDLVTFLVDDDVFYREPGLGLVGEGIPCSYRAGDYDYPCSLDGVVYAPATIVDRLPESFTDPTQLEAGLHVNRGELEIASWSPCLVGVPANVVSSSSNNPHMGVDVVELDRRYGAGDRLDLDATITPLLVGELEPAAHVELVLRWAGDRVTLAGPLGPRPA